MKIYVAGKFQEKAQVRAVQAALIADGHTITHDWTAHDVGHAEPGGPDWVEIYHQWYDPKELALQAAGDLLGVEFADAFVLCAQNSHKYSGALTEMGMALANVIPVYIIGRNLGSNIFTRLSIVEVYDTVEEVIVAINQ